MSETADSAFPSDLIAECRARYGRPTRDHPRFSRCRRNARSFPTDYSLSEPNEATVAEHIVRVMHELGIHHTTLGQARQSTLADMRVFAGPSEADIAALPHIDDAWHLAEFICADLGLRADTWTRKGMRQAHVRYGVMLDWTTRDVAQRLARERDGLDQDAAYELYGLDPYRVAMEHGAEPSDLDKLAAKAGLRKLGELSPDRLYPLFARPSLLGRLFKKRAQAYRELPPES